MQLAGAAAPTTPIASHARRRACKPHDRRADRDLGAVALDVRAPVGQARDLAAQALHRHRQLHAVGLDRAADLRRRALRHQLWPPRPADRWQPRALAGADRGRRLGADTLSRILRASSIAMFGTGGEPFLTALAAISPAIAPSTTQDHGHREEAPEVREFVADREVVVEQPRAARPARTRAPPMKNTPAATPTTAPLTSLVAFSVISAFASSISSRTSSVARSETSAIAAAMFCVSVSARRSPTARPRAVVAARSLRRILVEHAPPQRSPLHGGRRCPRARSRPPAGPATSAA